MAIGTQDPQVQQHVFTLAWLASDASAYKWSQARMQEELDFLSGRIDSFRWKVVWGPHYFLQDAFVPANTMYVAQQLDADGNELQVYVVAIAGTNATSNYDQIEDLDITPTPWPHVRDRRALMVTAGDLKGFEALRTLQVLPGFDLQGWLNLVLLNNKDVTLWFTGHSLAGALSPMLMLALMDPNSDLNQKNPLTDTSLYRWKQVNLLSVAGPSIGYPEFVEYFNQVFSAGNATAAFIWNGNDVVPHAWNNDSMQALTGFYGITFPPLGSCVGFLLGLEQANAAQYQYAMWEQTPTFTYKLQTFPQDTSTGGNCPEDGAFLAQMGFQHLNAYVLHFNCPWFPADDPCADPLEAYLGSIARIPGTDSATPAAVAAEPPAAT